jgi:hypothetical protein
VDPTRYVINVLVTTDFAAHTSDGLSIADAATSTR